MSMFKPATKAQSKARIGLCGPAGSGKTYTGLVLATALGQRVAVIDTERGSASKYADEFSFDVLELHHFSPRTYVDAIKAAEQAGYDVCLIDSLSHAWNAEGGVLEIVDTAAARSRGNSYVGWREGTPAHNALVNAMLQSSLHIIATMRSKTEYVLEDDGRGKKVPRKVGMAPIQRDGMEYEFDIVGDLDWEHQLIITKSRCRALADKVIKRPDAAVAQTIRAWLSDGVPVQPGSKRPASKDALIARIHELYADAKRLGVRLNGALPPAQLQAMSEDDLKRHGLIVRQAIDDEMAEEAARSS
jgi:hypothetical protein